MSRITLPITGVQPTYLRLKKQRFVCKDCKKSFTAKTPIVKKNCFISENTIAQVVIKSAEAQPLLSIGRDCSVSSTTVQRVIMEVAKAYKPHHQALPKHLSFDEFKYAKGQMAFEYIKVVTIDMNAGYANVIKEMFPQAEIIIDCFHLVQLINRAMNKCRVRIMNTFNTSKGEDQKKYRRLKRYWKLLLKRNPNYRIQNIKIMTCLVND